MGSTILTRGQILTSKKSGRKYEIDSISDTTIWLVWEHDRGWACDTKIIKKKYVWRYYY